MPGGRGIKVWGEMCVETKTNIVEMLRNGGEAVAVKRWLEIRGLFLHQGYSMNGIRNRPAGLQTPVSSETLTSFSTIDF